MTREKPWGNELLIIESQEQDFQTIEYDVYTDVDMLSETATPTVSEYTPDADFT